MRVFSWGAWRAEVDEDAIRRRYSISPVWDCNCGCCRNFAALARGRRLPAEGLEILDALGVPPEKASYVCELFHEGRTLRYEVAYRLAGRVLETAQTPERLPSGGELTCGREAAPGTAEDFPEPWFDLMFDFELPWVLDEPMDGAKEENA